MVMQLPQNLAARRVCFGVGSQTPVGQLSGWLQVDVRILRVAVHLMLRKTGPEDFISTYTSTLALFTHVIHPCQEKLGLLLSILRDVMSKSLGVP